MPDGLEQFLALIGAGVSLVVAIGSVYRLWQLGVRGWLNALNARVARVYWKVPKHTLVVLPAQAANVWWEMGQKDGAPCMQVVGEFFFTNISDEPVLVPKTSLVVYGSRYWFIPTSHRVEGNILVRQAQGYLFGHTDIPSRGFDSSPGETEGGGLARAGLFYRRIWERALDPDDYVCLSGMM